ncbi:MAG: RimK family alpha-L-glutamate ligase [Clostridia bacterium]|nr:RimK family alpha-L-glutamate ligase [Clostridia bacterium]
MRGHIVVNSYMKSPAQVNQAVRLRDEFSALGADVDIVKTEKIVKLTDGKVETPLTGFCVFLDKDKVVCRLLEKAGIRVFNSACAMELCDDKMLTHAALANSGVPMPDSICAPLCYYDDACVSDDFFSYVKTTLGFPMVAKRSYGSLGNEVYMIDDEKALRDFERAHKLEEHFYQKYVNSFGRDIRCVVVGGKFLCSYMRVNVGDFRSNIEQGGEGVEFEADSSVIALSEKAAKILGLDYCGVDILTEGDRTYLCEVNSNAFFAVAEKVTGVNIAGAYVRHVLKCVG